MKIALVSPYDYAHPGGVVVHITNLYEELKNIGHDVRIITPCSGKSQRIESQDIITIGRPIPIHSGGSIARVPVSPWLSSPVRDILERERFDIVHLHEPLASTLTVCILRESNSINIGTFHAHHSSSWGYRAVNPLAKRWFNKLHGRIAVSKPAMEFVHKYFSGDYAIIPNGVNVKRFSTPVPKINRFQDEKLNILFVGRSEKRKGLKYLLSAYKTVKREFPQCRLIVVGPGNNKYEGSVKRAKLEDIVFTGFVSNEELPRYYQTADVFCSPAIGGESFGLILLEAMAASRPIVASSIPGYASVMTNGTEGLLVPPKDEQALAEALIQLLRDERGRNAMGARGRQRAEECDWPNVAKMVNEYYMSLLEAS